VLHLAILGDMLSGDNHEDLDVTNASVMADQTFEMGRALYDMIVRLRQSGQFGEVRVYIVRGNHPRAHKIPRHKQPHANYEYLMGRHVAEMVRLTHGLGGVSVEVPRSSRLVVEVAGRRVCLTHGDGVKAASFAGIPWYAMKSKRDALQAMHRALGISQVDQISMGHFHQHVHWPSDCNIVVNGSIKGGDEYVQDTRYAHTPPMQIVQDWHPRKGLASTELHRP
jgi:predicted phosphodiesterase